jgi:hypothetical protein
MRTEKGLKRTPHLHFEPRDPAAKTVPVYSTSASTKMSGAPSTSDKINEAALKELFHRFIFQKWPKISGKKQPSKNHIPTTKSPQLTIQKPRFSGTKMRNPLEKQGGIAEQKNPRLKPAN